jgi:hypothetical protein
VQVVGQFATERVGLLRHQFRQHLLLLLLVQLGRVSAGVRARTDQTFFAIALPDATRRRGRAGHDLGHVVAFQPALKELDDPASHSQRKCLHAAPWSKNRWQHT